MKYTHTPVMLAEVLEFLDPLHGDLVLDCTLGGGGYTEAILDRVGDSGAVLALDADPLAIKNAKTKFKNKNNLTINHANFKDLHQIGKEYTQEKGLFDGIVFDLGLSSAQLEDRNRGFSFQSNDPLNMSFGDEEGPETTVNIVNYWSRDELAKIFREYGEEKFANRIADKIVEARSESTIRTTGQLIDLVMASVPKTVQKKRIHPATRIFQALRIATNDELGSLQIALDSVSDLVEYGARIVVVSYHSLEDRIVKQFLRREARDCLCPSTYPICQCDHRARLEIITKRPVITSDEEKLANPRSRSAKLRAAKFI